MPETPDPVAAALARIRERRDCARPQSGLPAHPPQARVLGEDEDDFPRLLAALEAGLKRHVPAFSARLVPCAEHAHWSGPLVGPNDNLAVRRACPRCEVFEEPYCGSCVDHEGRFQDWPCGEYRAVSRELLTKEGNVNARDPR